MVYDEGQDVFWLTRPDSLFGPVFPVFAGAQISETLLYCFS